MSKEKMLELDEKFKDKECKFVCLAPQDVTGDEIRYLKHRHLVVNPQGQRKTYMVVRLGQDVVKPW